MSKQIPLDIKLGLVLAIKPACLLRGCYSLVRRDIQMQIVSEWHAWPAGSGGWRGNWRAGSVLRCDFVLRFVFIVVVVAFIIGF